MAFRLRPPRYLVPVIVACALFMENMDATVIATALPTIARDFGESALALNLAITCYLLSLGIFLPLSGWLADRFGARTVFTSAIVVFTLGLDRLLDRRVAAAARAGAHRPGHGRGDDGAGRPTRGAAHDPEGRARRPRWRISPCPALIGPVIGPPLGGFIVTYFSWRWIFLINIPDRACSGSCWRCASSRTCASRARSRSTALGLRDREPGPRRRRCSASRTWGAASCRTSGSRRSSRAGSCSSRSMRGTRARVPAPILDVALLARADVPRVGRSAASSSASGIGALPFLTPLMLQLGFGLSPFASGMITFSGAAGAITMKLTAAPILRTSASAACCS